MWYLETKALAQRSKRVACPFGDTSFAQTSRPMSVAFLSFGRAVAPLARPNAAASAARPAAAAAAASEARRGAGGALGAGLGICAALAQVPWESASNLSSLQLTFCLLESNLLTSPFFGG